MIYVFIFLILIILRYSLVGRQDIAVNVYPWVLFFLFLFSAFRFEVGCDWGNYRTIHLQTQLPIGEIWFRVLTEPSHLAISKILHFFGLSYLWMMVFSSGVFFYGVNKLAKRSPDPLGFIILLFPILIMNMPMSSIKQGAAIGVLCIAFIAFFDGKLLKFVLLVALAASFHPSAIIFIALILFVKGALTNKRLLAALFLSIPFLGILSLSSLADTAVTRYVNGPAESAGALFRIGMLVLTASVFFIFFNKKYQKFSTSEYKLMYLTSLMMLGCFLMLPISSIIADRVGYYLIPMQAYFFVSIPAIKNVQFRVFWSAWPYLMLSTVFIFWTSFSFHFSHCYVPYKSWLMGVPGFGRDYETDEDELLIENIK